MGATVFDEGVRSRFNQGLFIVPFLWFKESLDLKEVQQHLLAKLSPIMRFRSRMIPVKDTLSVASAYQEMGPGELEASISKMVVEERNIKTTADLDKFVSEMYNTGWDPELPLWRGYVINDLEDGRSLLLMKIDHAIGDGVALLSVLDCVVDKTEDSNFTGLPEKSRSRMPTPPSCLAGCVMQMKGCWRAFYGPLVKDNLPGDPPNRLKCADARNPGKTKAVCQTPPLKLEAVKKIKNQIPEATVNDVLMTLTCLTLREYFLKYEPSSLTKQVRATMPISMRKGEDDVYDQTVFGNNFSQGHLYFPLQISDPMEMFKAMKAQIDVIKVSPEPLVRDKIVKFITTQSCIPQSFVAALLLDAFGKVTIMLSNVVGPLNKVNIMGKELDDLTFYAMVPLGLYFGIVQYNGEIKVGLCVDADVEPEPSQLSECWVEAFRKLQGAADGLSNCSCCK